MTETEQLRSIFGDPLSWRGYEVRWCELCGVYSIWCKECSGSSCNCMCCDKCRKDQKDFSTLKTRPEAHMNGADRIAVDKYHRIKRFIETCIEHNKGKFDWEWLYYHGMFCKSDWDVFDEVKAFEPYDTATVKNPELFPYLKP